MFKTISQESGLTIDNVEKIMGDVEDVSIHYDKLCLSKRTFSIGYCPIRDLL